MPERFLVVGGTSGIGVVVVRQLARAGGEVIQLSRHPERSPDLPRVRGVLWDARDAFPVDAIPEALDGLVYCPGSIRLKPFARLREAEVIEDFELNLMGVVRALQACLPALQGVEAAAVVLFSTVAVQIGMPYHASVASAKGAVEGLARALAAELAPRIRVNVVAPTITDTPLAERLLNDGRAWSHRVACPGHRGGDRFLS